MGEVGIVVVVVNVGVDCNGAAADDVEEVERAQLGSERRQFCVDELADTIEG